MPDVLDIHRCQLVIATFSLAFLKPYDSPGKTLFPPLFYAWEAPPTMIMFTLIPQPNVHFYPIKRRCITFHRSKHSLVVIAPYKLTCWPA